MINSVGSTTRQSSPSHGKHILLFWWGNSSVFLYSYLHSCSPPIIHGNLTCDTIFIQHNGLVKIGSGNKWNMHLWNVHVRFPNIVYCYLTNYELCARYVSENTSVVYSSCRWSWKSFLINCFIFPLVAPDSIHQHVKTCNEKMTNMHFIAPEYASKYNVTTLC